MTVIKDGTGEGFLAQVGSLNDLHVKAIAFDEISGAGEAGVAFMAEGETTIVAATEKTVLILVNTGDTNLQIGNIIISVKTETGKITVVKCYLGSNLTVTGGTSKNSKNLNTGSVTLANATLVENNPTITGTDTKILELYFQLGDGSSITIPFGGGIVIERNGSFRLTCTGDASGVTAGLTCDVAFQFWEERSY